MNTEHLFWQGVQPTPFRLWHLIDPNGTRYATLTQTDRTHYAVRLYPDGGDDCLSTLTLHGFAKAQAYAIQTLHHLDSHEADENAKALAILDALQ